MLTILKMNLPIYSILFLARNVTLNLRNEHFYTPYQDWKMKQKHQNINLDSLGLHHMDQINSRLPNMVRGWESGNNTRAFMAQSLLIN